MDVTPECRTEYVTAACRNGAELVHEVESLLDAEENAGLHRTVDVRVRAVQVAI